MFLMTRRSSRSGFVSFEYSFCLFLYVFLLFLFGYFVVVVFCVLDVVFDVLCLSCGVFDVENVRVDVGGRGVFRSVLFFVVFARVRFCLYCDNFNVGVFVFVLFNVCVIFIVVFVCMFVIFCVFFDFFLTFLVVVFVVNV